MSKPAEPRTAAAFGSYVAKIQRYFRLIIVVELVVTAALSAFTTTHLGVNMDNKKLLSPDLPFQQAARSYARYFPSLDDSLLVVVDAQTPEQVRQAARLLAAKIGEDHETFSDVYVPGASRFFQRYGLLYRTPDELDELVDRIATMQPVLAQLSIDPSIASLAGIVRRGLDQVERDSASAPPNWPAMLDKIGQGTVRVFDEYPVSVSWESVMVEGSALEVGTRQVIVAEPVLEFGRLLAAQTAVEGIRAAARELDLIPERGVTVRITGNPALNYEEMLELAWDIGVSTLFSLILVVALLYAALQSMRLVVAAAITLIIGLVWTAAFAAIAVGQLNVLSIAFAVLFIGLGVDFAIHLGMHFADSLRAGSDPRATMQRVIERIGGALTLCALTTAIGFLAFYPTGYRGVAELGLISAAGMFITLFQTVTLFPALTVALLGSHPKRTHDALPFQLSPPRVVATHPGTIATIALALGVLAATQLPHLRFDMNVIEMRDESTESVQAFRDLLARSDTSPWYINALAPDLDRANALAARMRKLDVVRSASTIADYVPTDQNVKREILSTLSMLLEVPQASPEPPPSTAEQVDALRKLHDGLGADWIRNDHSPLGESAGRLYADLEHFLKRIESSGDPARALDELQEVLLGNFPAQLDRLREAADPPPIGLADLPANLRRRMLAPDGHARVQIFPRDKLTTSDQVALFVDTVRQIDPQATGVAVNLLEFGRATSQSLRQALFFAFTAISALLLLLWRRPIDAALALAPLLLGAILTGGFMVAIDMPFNFANVVVLPLLIGIGVDSGIHLVHAAHGEGTSGENDEVLESVTARAVFFSALTTIASFGSLSLSSHTGIATMGMLLVSGIVIILACNLVVLPALLHLRKRRTG